MKLYYIIDKWIVDKNGIIAPILEKDVFNINYDSLNLFNENIVKYFINDKHNIHDETKISEYDYRMCLLYSIETDNLKFNYSLSNNGYMYTLKQLNELNLVDYKDIYVYNFNFKNLDWKLEKKLYININNFKLLFITENNNIQKLVSVIIQGDSPERLVRLKAIENNFNQNMQYCAKELYSILYDFSYGNYYNMNADGNNYYNAMEYLRNKYNLDNKN